MLVRIHGALLFFNALQYQGYPKSEARFVTSDVPGFKEHSGRLVPSLAEYSLSYGTLEISITPRFQTTPGAFLHCFRGKWYTRVPQGLQLESDN